MLYFIPAWYSEGEWKENEQIWYKRRDHTEMDDTVKQIQLFHRNKAYPYKILTLGASPNFRHFLHRQGLFMASYWSCFDAIQEVKRKKTALLSFHQLKWPKMIEFIYSPFAVIAMLHGEKYAQIEFGEDGNMIEVDLYKNGEVVRKNIYDDRGFISSTIVFEKGKMVYEQYLNEKGVWKLCKFADGHVIVNPKSDTFRIERDGKASHVVFKQQSYTGIDQVIKEVLQTYLDQTSQDDIFCVAMHDQHTQLLRTLLAGRKSVVSFFENRLPDASLQIVRDMMNESNYIITDSTNNQEKLVWQCGQRFTHMANIPPYDTRVDFGISTKLRVQKILIAVDHISDDVFCGLVAATAEYMQENENARVVFFTRSADYGVEERILERAGQALEAAGFNPAYARKETGKKFEILLDEDERLPILYSAKQCVDELAASTCIREQRIVVDLASAPDLFLQISCVSMGIPQITRIETQYVVNHKNGMIIRSVQKLPECLRFYLGSLKNWNTAMINAYEMGKQFTSQQLVAKWKEVIDKVERD